MKWIGQNIYDFISRFRNDVYLESISSGTIASGGNLGLDSNNKIVKATAADGDITGVTAGTGLSGGGTSGAVTLNVEASQTQITSIGTIGTGVWNGTAIGASYVATLNQDTTGSSGSCTGQAATVATISGLAPNTATTQATQPNIESIGTDGDTLSILGDTLHMYNTTTYKPLVKLVNTTDDANGPYLEFWNERTDSGVQAGEDGDTLGTISFVGYDDGSPVIQHYATISSTIHDATNPQESGRLTFKVANHDGGLGTGLTLKGGSENDEIDVTVGLGANSVVTIPGNIDLAGDIDVDGTLEADAITLGGTALGSLYSPIAGSSSIVTTGTIGTGTWQGTKVSSVYANTGGRRYGDILKILPQDFMKNDDSSGNALNYKDGANGGVQVDNASLEAIAFVAIPEGMKATHVDMSGSTAADVVVIESSITESIAWSGASAATDLAGGSGAMNSQITLSSAVDATADNMLGIKVTLTATNQRIYGGKVTIAAQ